jgi:acetyl esterase/lipase
MRGLVLHLAAAVIGLSPFLGHAQAQPPVEAFAQLPAMRSPSLSPDGKRLLAIQDVDGRPGVVIYTVGAPPGTKPVVLPSDEWLIWSAQWVSNDRVMMIAGKGTKRPGRSGDLWTLNRSIIVSADGSNPVRVLDNIDALRYNSSSAWVLDLSIAEPNHIYMPLLEQGDGAVLLNLFQIDVNTGRGVRHATATRDTGGWLMDGKGNIVARLEQTRKSRVQSLVVPDAGGGWRDIASVQTTADSGLNLLGLSEDGSSFMRAALSGQRYVISKIDLATGKEQVVLSDPNYDVAGVVIDKWTGRVVGAEMGGDSEREAFFSPDRKSLGNALRKAFPGMAVWEESYDVSRQTFVVGVMGPRHPTSYFYLNRTTKVVDEIMPTYPGLTEADLGEMKPYDYPARDGLRIPAYITLPPGRAPKNLPAVVMPHGGPDARDTLGFDWWAQFMASRGYVVLQPNFRGSAGYGRAFTEAGLQQWGLKMQDDITDGVKKMIADGIVDPKRVCIVGASYGGYAALAGATLTPEMYACSVSVAGVSDLPEMLSYERRTSGKNSGAVRFWASRIGSEDEDSERLRATSPARQAARARAPIMLLHGENDTTVPIEQSEMMVEALQDAGKPVTFIKLEGDDHYLHLASTRLQMLRALEGFLAEHIGR